MIYSKISDLKENDENSLESPEITPRAIVKKEQEIVQDTLVSPSNNTIKRRDKLFVTQKSIPTDRQILNENENFWEDKPQIKRDNSLVPESSIFKKRQTLAAPDKPANFFKQSKTLANF